jgi:methionyl-tRNA formyltransferase
MNLVFLGSGAFGLPTLQRLAAHHTIQAVISQPDRPAGRGSSLTPTPIADWAATNLSRIPLLKPENINEPEVTARVRGFPADAWVVIAFGQKLGKPLLEGRFAINLHASLLPRWRGAAPINAAILAGDAITGNSVITLADRMDAGLILGRSQRPADPNLTAGELHDLLAADGPDLVEEVLARHAAATLAPVTQDESLVTIARKLKKEDGRVDWSLDAPSIRRRIHGLTPWPGVAAAFRGEPLKLLRAADTADSSGASPGTLSDAAKGLVACGDGTTLRLIEVQPAGKKPMKWEDFARGRSPRDGEPLSA